MPFENTFVHSCLKLSKGRRERAVALYQWKICHAPSASYSNNDRASNLLGSLVGTKSSKIISKAINGDGESHTNVRHVLRQGHHWPFHPCINLALSDGISGSNLVSSSFRWSNEKSYISTTFCSLMRQSISITVYWASENLKVTMVAHVNLDRMCAWRAIVSEAFVGPFFLPNSL